MTPAERTARMERLAKEANPARRRMLALGIVSDRLREIGLEPVLVGGGALEFYTAGGYTTGDVDLALPHGRDVDESFADLGFQKDGRFWIREDLDLYFEAPAPYSLPGETAPRTRVEIEGLQIVVLGVDDLLMDRLRAWVHWKSGEDERWAKHLAALYAERLDWAYLKSKVQNSEEEAALSNLHGTVRTILSEEGS